MAGGEAYMQRMVQEIRVRNFSVKTRAPPFGGALLNRGRLGFAEY